jgi:hypothetical protein
MNDKVYKIYGSIILITFAILLSIIIIKAVKEIKEYKNGVCDESCIIYQPEHIDWDDDDDMYDCSVVFYYDNGDRMLQHYYVSPKDTIVRFIGATGEESNTTWIDSELVIFGNGHMKLYIIIYLGE